MTILGVPSVYPWERIEAGENSLFIYIYIYEVCKWLSPYTDLVAVGWWACRLLSFGTSSDLLMVFVCTPDSCLSLVAAVELLRQRKGGHFYDEDPKRLQYLARVPEWIDKRKQWRSLEFFRVFFLCCTDLSWVRLGFCFPNPPPPFFGQTFVLFCPVGSDCV